MKYKIGDEVLLKAKIVDIDESKVYPYNIAIELGDTWKTDDYSCEESAIIDKYEKASTDPGLIEKKCSCFHIENSKPVCNGTKEKDVCSCNGDKTKCDFYPDVKEKATEQNRVVTAEEYREALRYLYCGVTSATVNKIFNMPVSFSWSTLCILDNYTSTEVVDAVEKHKKEHDVQRYEIFENENCDEDWLVTYVNCNTVYLINREGKTASMGKDILLNGYKRTGEKRYLQDFVMG